MSAGRLFLVLGACAAAGWAQSPAGVAGPVTGFIFDAPAGAIRPMLGIPGAAYLGGLMATGLGKASVSPDGSAALAVQPGGKLVLYTGLRSAALVPVSVSGSLAGADRFAWAADSSSAAVYSSETGQAQIVTGVAKSPAGGPPIDLSGLPGRVTALAFDGTRVIVGVSGDSGGVFRTGGGSAVERIATAASPSAIAVAGSNLYFTDNQAQQIWQVESYAGTPAAVLFASDSSINSPAGMQVSSDGLRLYVANAGSRKLTVYDVASRTVAQSLDLACTPTRLDRFGDARVFLLNDSGNGPLYVARDGGPGKAAVYFVPAPVRRPAKAPIHPA